MAACSPSSGLLSRRAEHSAGRDVWQGRRDGRRDALCREAEARVLRLADARPQALNAWDAWDGVRRDARADAARREPHPPLADGAGKSAGRARGGREQDATPPIGTPGCTGGGVGAYRGFVNRTRPSLRHDHARRRRLRRNWARRNNRRRARRNRSGRSDSRSSEQRGEIGVTGRTGGAETGGAAAAGGGAIGVITGRGGATGTVDGRCACGDNRRRSWPYHWRRNRRRPTHRRGRRNRWFLSWRYRRAGGAKGSRRSCRRCNCFLLLRDRFQHIPGTGNVREIDLGLDFFFAAKRARTGFARGRRSVR